MAKKKQAHKVLFKDGSLAGVRTPYSPKFNRRARAEGYIWIGKRWGNYWKEDERLLITGQIPTGRLQQALQQKREQLISLAAEYFEIGPDEMLETAVSSQ